MRSKDILFLLPFFVASSIGVGLTCATKINKSSPKNEVLAQSEQIEQDVNDELILANEEAENNDELFYVTEYRLDTERKYTGYVDSSYIPQSFGTLTWIYTNCVYTGEFLDGLYSGCGTFEWRNEGNVLIGSWENNEPTYGMLRYSNTMRYIGHFKNFTFDGKGLFDWTTYNNDGSLKENGWLYEGQFKAGTIAGCYGRITMNRTGTGSGVYYFEGLMSGFPAISPNQQGKGKIVFDDGSVYVGQILYDGSNYYRHGRGEQFFYNVTGYTGATAGGDMRDKIYSYVGDFNRTGWMKGNGVVYFCDNDLKPTSYITGFWDGFSRISDWASANAPKIKDEWKSTSERQWVHEYYAKLRGYVDMNKDESLDGKVLLLGPSTIEYWYTSKQDLSPEYNSLNFGIGGAGPQFFNENLDLLDELTGCPDKILFSTANNDLAANRTSLNQMIANVKEIVEKLHSKFSSATVYLTSNVSCESRWYLNEETLAFNEDISTYASSKDYVKYINVMPSFFGTTPNNFYLEGYGYLRTDLFRDDKLHYNNEGYTIYANLIKEGLSA